jgi:hypothetical protein
VNPFEVNPSIARGKGAGTLGVALVGEFDAAVFVARYVQVFPKATGQ